MAVDLPPPMPPQQASVADAKQGEAVTTFAAHDFQIHLFGARELDAERVAAIVNGADTISNGLRALISAYYAAGYPGVKLTYAPAAADLYVLITLDGVASVKAAAPLGKYFKGLGGTGPLTDDDLEPRRALASMHADRASLAGKSKLEPAAGGAAFAVRADKGQSSTGGYIQVGNPGNRYVGRYFADMELHTGTRSGDELISVTRTTLGGEDAAANGEFIEQDLAWNRVSTWGIFGIGGRYIEFSFDPVPGTTQDSTIWLGEARWQYPLMADFNSRLSAQAKIDRTSKTSELAQTGVATQRELYNSAELSATYQWTSALAGPRWEFETGLAGRQGLGDGKEQVAPVGVVPTDLDYTLYRGALILRRHFAPDDSVSLETSGQYSASSVPEQQQIVLGGFANLPAYLPGVTFGDSGFLSRLVGAFGRYPLLGLQMRPKLFVEAGSVRYNGSGTGQPGLADAGLLLDMNRGKWLEMAVVYAEGIADQDLTEAQLDAFAADAYFTVKIKF